MIVPIFPLGDHCYLHTYLPWCSGL